MATSKYRPVIARPAPNPFGVPAVTGVTVWDQNHAYPPGDPARANKCTAPAFDADLRDATTIQPLPVPSSPLCTATTPPNSSPAAPSGSKSRAGDRVHALFFA